MKEYCCAGIDHPCPVTSLEGQMFYFRNGCFSLGTDVSPSYRCFTLGTNAAYVVSSLYRHFTLGTDASYTG